MFSRNSHTPSLAITTTLSSFVNVYSDISGSALQPTLCATESPNERVIARPGTSSTLSQTLNGPKGLPLWSLYESILPLFLIIRSASSLSSGLWSLVRAVAVHNYVSPPGTDLMTIPLESPTLAMYSFLPSVMTLTQVEPLKENKLKE